jgi:hypothetical protein
MDDTSIPFANCSDGQYIYATELTKEYREQYKKLHIHCPECGAKLIVAIKNEHYFFKHYSNQSCLFESKKFNKEYREYILYQSRESEKHKLLKNKLKEKLELSDDLLIDKNSVCIEKYTDGRRADVYCERNSKKIAFEVQISPLSLSIILGRINHYRDKEIHLFWIIESTKFQKPQFQKDIKHYGLSEHIYELSSDDKLLKCHYKAPKIDYKNGSLHIIPSNGEINIDLSDLKIINGHPALFDYEKEEEKLKSHKVGTNPIFKESYVTINGYLSWFEKYPKLNQQNIFLATRIVDFIPYIEVFLPKLIHWSIDEPDSDPYMYLECPICRSVSEYSGCIEVKSNTSSCLYCDYKNIDLIQYIADMKHKGNKFKAAQEICFNLTIPYKSGI